MYDTIGLRARLLVGKPRSSHHGTPRGRSHYLGHARAVNFELMVKGLQTKGNVNHILYWSRLPDWKNQLPTPNPDTMYFLPF